jgi:hypothetical protein
VLSNTPAGRPVTDLLAAKQADNPDAAVSGEVSDVVLSEESKTDASEVAVKEETEESKPANSKGMTVQPLTAQGKPAEDKDENEEKPATDDTVDAQAESETATELGDLGDKSKKPEEEELPPAELYGGKPVIEIHEAHPVRSAFIGFLIFLLVLALALAAFNFLLDAGVVSLGVDVPHTDLLEP